MYILNKTKFRLSQNLCKQIKLLQIIVPENIEKCQKIIDFTLIFVTCNVIKKINKSSRNLNVVTDVLSFRDHYDFTVSELERAYIGDIYICLEIAKKQQHVEKINEIIFLTIHGLLHLLGFDHVKKMEKREMFKYQKKIINAYLENHFD